MRTEKRARNSPDFVVTDHIWVFVLRVPSTSEVPVVLLNQLNQSTILSHSEGKAVG